MINQTKEDFSDQTDRLADALKLSLKELAAQLDMSSDSLFGYRTGRLPISSKAWRKLRARQEVAGLIYSTKQTNSDRPVREIPQDDNARAARHTGMVSESSPSDPTHSWDDVVSYVRTLKQLDLTPDEVIELLQREYPLRLGKKT